MEGPTALRPGDRIIAVAKEGEEPLDIVNMPLHKVVRMIRGKKGTVAHLTVIKSLNAVPQMIPIVRDEVKLEDSAASGELKRQPVRRTDGGPGTPRNRPERSRGCVRPPVPNTSPDLARQPARQARLPRQNRRPPAPQAINPLVMPASATQQ